MADPTDVITVIPALAPISPPNAVHWEQQRETALLRNLRHGCSTRMKTIRIRKGNTLMRPIGSMRMGIFRPMREVASTLLLKESGFAKNESYVCSNAKCNFVSPLSQKKGENPK